MTFDTRAEVIAREAIQQIDPALVKQYTGVIKFLAAHPTAAATVRGVRAPRIGTAEYVRKQAAVFAQSREPRAPKAPETIPDEMVTAILCSYFGIAHAHADRVKKEHLLAMAAENIVGELLERYLASIMEPNGWIWCSGSMVKAVDFIQTPSTHNGTWRLLQVKNRDNSENSSSSAIRIGTDIEKWHRTFSRKKDLNWAKFPDESIRKDISEESFKTFVEDYLRNLRDLNNEIGRS
jgi:hypothetical protein